MSLFQDLQPTRLLPALTAGLIVGIINIIVQISFAAMIFSGDLSIYVARGIGVTLFSAVVIGTISALTSSYPGMVSVPQDSPAAISAIIAAAILASLPTSVTLESAFLTVIAAVALASLLTGAFSLALGLFRLGRLIRYIPYPVIGGFLAGTGWFLVRGAMGVMTDFSLSFAALPTLLQPDILIKWLPGLVFAVGLLAILRRYSHSLIVPGMLLGAVGVFYLVLALTDTSVADASANGLLLGPFPEGGLWQPFGPAALSQVHWSAVFGQLGSIATIILLSVISLLLNASGLELAVREDVDLDRELSSIGVANLAAGLGGGLAGYPALSLAVLGARMGANSRLVGLSATVLYILMLLLGASTLSYFPKVVVGGLLLFLGLAFLVEWLYDAWVKLSKTDYLIVVLILVAMATFGVLEGVGLGVVLAVALFVIEYSRIDVIKHTLTGASYHSSVERPRSHQRILRTQGEAIYILELQGFIFFGTANRLFEAVRERFNTPKGAPDFIVLDFRRVSGLDASAVLAFNKMKQSVQGEEATLVFTGLAPKMLRQLGKDVFTEEDKAIWQVFSDMDHGVEWCEGRLLESAIHDKTVPPQTVKQQLETFLLHPDRYASLAEDIARPDEKAALPDTIAATRLGEYLQRLEFSAGDQLIQQGEASQGLYFIEEGQVTVQLEGEARQATRIRTVGAGTIVGEIGLYLGTPTTAAVVADQHTVVFLLTAEALKRMEVDDPDIAAAFHKFIAQLLGERVLTTTTTLQTLLA